MSFELTPSQIVEKLNEYIIGQENAKKALAVALRNRYRRKKVAEELRDEIIPKNILMIGPTGVGKTELARRLAKLVKAPFIKVEATKYTEVGYVGKDVESIIRDLMNFSVNMVRNEYIEKVKPKVEEEVIEEIIDILMGDKEFEEPKQDFGKILSSELKKIMGLGNDNVENKYDKGNDADYWRKRADLRMKLLQGLLDEEEIQIQVKSGQKSFVEVFTSSGVEEVGLNVANVLGNMFPEPVKFKTVKIKDAKEILFQQKIDDHLDFDEIVREAKKRVEEDGIVFIDEIDKVAAKFERGPDVSREGVQRDLLPLIEGTTVMTKFGPIKTDHILFIAAGAFSIARPSDLIPELQGRLPIRVELDSLSKEDFARILVEPKNALTKQYKHLLETEGIVIEFTEEAVEKIAEIAVDLNTKLENTGARRLYTLMEKLLEDIMFDVPDKITSSEITIDKNYVEEKLSSLVKDEEYSKYIF